MKILSIVVPCYNEEKNIALLHQRVAAIFKNLHGYIYELIFVDNA